MSYEMKNRFLIIGLTGPLGSGCTNTGKFLSGKRIDGITVKELLLKQIGKKEHFNFKIKKEYQLIENLKNSISKRISKNLGPYKNLILKPNEDPIIQKLEREATKRHNRLKIYLRKREVTKVLEKFLNDKAFHYDNLNIKDKEVFGFRPFIYISFTSMIIKLALESFYKEDGEDSFNSYFENKIKENDTKKTNLTYNAIKRFIYEKFKISEDERNSYFASNTFVRDRNYAAYKGGYNKQFNQNILDRFKELIRKFAVSYYAYLS